MSIFRCWLGLDISPQYSIGNYGSKFYAGWLRMLFLTQPQLLAVRPVLGASPTPLSEQVLCCVWEVMCGVQADPTG